MADFYTNAYVAGDAVLVRGYLNGIRYQTREKYEPSLFVPDSNGDWANVHGKRLKQVNFDGPRAAKDYVRQFSDVDNFELHGTDRFAYAYINERWPDQVQYDVGLIRVLALDIEVDSTNGFVEPEDPKNHITAITMHMGRRGYVSYGLGDYKPTRTDVTYRKFKNEEALLRAVVLDWSDYDPDVVTGWNIEAYDIPYLFGRVERILGDESLKVFSPWRRVRRVNANVRTFGGQLEQTTRYDVGGVAILDYMVLHKKFTYTQHESYALDYIAHVEIGEKKLDYSEFASLHDLYRRDHQKFIEYNIRDVELILRIEDKMRLLELAYALAYDAKVNLQDVFSQVRMWDVITHNHLWKNKVAVRTAGGGTKYSAFVGAYVKEPQCGMHDWVVSFDLISLYPHLIMGYNISPETIIRQGRIDIEDVVTFIDKVPIVPEGMCLAPNGVYFSTKKQGFLPDIMERMYTDRARYKSLMIESQKKLEATTDQNVRRMLEKDVAKYRNFQEAKKRQLNSAYGAMGNQYFRFFDIDMATAITMGGQLAIRWVVKCLNEKLNASMATVDFDYIIASDTDSIYVNFGPLVAKMNMKTTKAKVDFLDKVSREFVQPALDEIFVALAKRMGCAVQKMSMKRECIAERAIWTAKKKYILSVWDLEGVRYDKPKIKITGIEAVKSSTPAACRVAIKRAIEIIMNADQRTLWEFVDEFNTKFRSMEFEDVAFPRSVQNIEKFAANPKGIPIHVRAALAYNDELCKHGLDKRYQIIRSGDKMKFCYMTLPNNVMAAGRVLPRELGVHTRIDWEVQFDKAFVAPVQNILDHIGWTAVKKPSLMDFMS